MTEARTTSSHLTSQVAYALPRGASVAVFSICAEGRDAVRRTRAKTCDGVR